MQKSAEMDHKSSAGVLSVVDLQTVIKHILKATPFTIKNYNIEPANSEASGVLATHSRVFVNVQVGTSNKCFQFFVKSYPEQDSTKAFAKEFGAFKKEVGFYTEILQELIRFGVSLPYAVCYHGRTDDVNDFVVLEDLSKSEYRLVNRRNGLDFEHCAVTLKGLARLHATSVIHEKNKRKPLNKVYDYLFYTFFNPEDRGNKAENIFQQNIDTFKKLVTLMPQYKNSIHEVQKQLDDAYDKASKFLSTSDVLNVVCHGDIWINNILFKYEKQGDNEILVDAKLVDLQLVTYGPPTIDLLVFFYASTTRSFREQNVNKLLEIYYECFSNTLSALGESVPKFTLQFLREDFQRRRLYGVGCAMQYLPFCLLEQEGLEECAKSEDVNDFIESSFTRRIVNQFNRDELYRSRLTETLIEFLELSGTK